MTGISTGWELRGSHGLGTEGGPGSWQAGFDTVAPKCTTVSKRPKLSATECLPLKWSDINTFLVRQKCTFSELVYIRHLETVLRFVGAQ